MLSRTLGSVQGRVVAGSIVVLLMLVTSVALSTRLANRHRVELQAVESTSSEAEALADAKADVLLADLGVLDYLETGDASNVPGIRLSLAAARDRISAAEAARSALGNANATASRSAALERLHATTSELSDTAGAVIAARDDHNVATAFDLLSAATPKTLQYWADLSAEADAARADANQHQAEASRTGTELFWTIVATGVAGVLLTLTALASAIWSVVRPLRRLESTALAVSNGDLAARAHAAGPRELARVGEAFDQMTERLLGRKAEVETLNVSLEKKVAELEAEIANREKAERHIRHLAYHDTLTGLPNRLDFKERLERLLAAPLGGRCLAVLFVDLDRFKIVNDTAGHVEGDRMLRNVARALGEATRDGDLVGRIGGDEFVVLLTGLSHPGEAAAAAQRIVENLREPQRLGSHEFNITASVGIATYPGDERDAEALIRHADIAMYEAKSLGRDGYQFYTPEMNQSIIDRLEIENELRHAVERHELEVYYQPLNAADDRRIAGAEALLRWHHPVRGLIMPSKFIPIAEETGLIVSIGEWMMRVACAQAKAWQDAGRPEFRIAVNLSARQFQQAGLLETIISVLGETGLPARSLQLEVTESTIIVDLDYAVAVLNQLRALGVEVAIDDFGTGHSGLSYLNQLPVDVLKIDRSFISNILANGREAEITTTVIALAHTLGLKVVAEGVENEEQFAFLRDRDCDKVQGYLFSEPIPAHAFGALDQGEAEAEAA